jgi:hypothetical protein
VQSTGNFTDYETVNEKTKCKNHWFDQGIVIVLNNGSDRNAWERAAGVSSKIMQYLKWLNWIEI